MIHPLLSLVQFSIPIQEFIVPQKNARENVKKWLSINPWTVDRQLAAKSIHSAEMTLVYC